MCINVYILYRYIILSVQSYIRYGNKWDIKNENMLHGVMCYCVFFACVGSSYVCHAPFLALPQTGWKTSGVCSRVHFPGFCDDCIRNKWQ